MDSQCTKIQRQMKKVLKMAFTMIAPGDSNKKTHPFDCFMRHLIRIRMD